MDAFNDYLNRDVRRRKGQKVKNLVWLGDWMDDRTVHRNFKDRGEATHYGVRGWMG